MVLRVNLLKKDNFQMFMGRDSANLDYLFVLKSLNEIPFGVGKKLLVAFLKGDDSNPSVIKNKLFSMDNFGCLAYEDHEIEDMVDNLVLNGLISLVSIGSNRFWKVMEITEKGRQEIIDPQLYKKKLSYNFKDIETVITEKDRIAFDAFGSFLEKYNDGQKKSIISGNSHILCLAGAGSGKTTVLTKRIEFLVKYKSIDPRKILAITFTRKARQEMMSRVDSISGLGGVHIETFNSFCEKLLKRHNNLVYDTDSVRVISYRDKIVMVNKAVSKLGLNMDRAVNTYFTYAQRMGKTKEQLANVFMNDCFFIRDYFKFKNRVLEEASFETSDVTHMESAKLVFGVCNYIEDFMKQHGLRDFADQLVDTITLFNSNPNLISDFDHVLIDEYQDVNSTQVHLIDLLKSNNLFCVGDPRQSIYGWRGSDIKYILNFEDKFPSCEIITLTKNYRSTKHIVNLFNESIRKMGLADLESAVDGEKDIRLINFGSESSEFEFVIQTILSSQVPRKEIFVISRTNRQLNDLSQLMKSRDIDHIVRSDDMKRDVESKKGAVTLATIHSIKGLEAKTVFVIGANGSNFPCKGSEHPVVDMIKVDEYDKEEEERRLFYVAISRAKKSLYISYTGKRPTNFITDKMLDLLGEDVQKSTNKSVQKSASKLSVSAVSSVVSNNLLSRLKEWRKNISSELGVPAFMVLHDKTLIDMTQKMPINKSELEDINGLGPTKIMKYGDDLLDIIIG